MRELSGVLTGSLGNIATGFPQLVHRRQVGGFGSRGTGMIILPDLAE